jgi:S-DNA-T family DNA segregation ATPase FtsK/SpoIIIE
MTGRPQDQRRGVDVQPHHWPMVFETAAIAVVAVFLTSVAARAEHVHPWVPAGLLLAAGLITMITVTVVTASGPLGLTVFLWTLVLPGWLLYAMLTSPWTWTAVLALVIPAGGVSAVTLVQYATHTDATRTETARLAKVEAARLVAEERAAAREHLGSYETILANLGAPGVRAVSEQETSAGHVVTMELPTTGKVKLSTLQALADNIATAMRLPVGGVSFEGGKDSGEVIMYLAVRDFLADELPFPAEYADRSINDPVNLGRQADGGPAEVLFREVAALLIGVSGSGKSNLMNVLIAWLTMCTDVVVWMIDLKGGRLAAPWIQPWVDGKCDRPAIDWVATTREEAEKMLNATDRIIDGRSESLEGGSKLIPTATRPQIVLFCDETSDLFVSSPDGTGPRGHVLAETGARITRKQRSEAVMALWGTQKGTADFIPSAIKSQCKLRFALASASQADASAVIPDDTAAAKLLASLIHAGTGLIWRPGRKVPVATKFFRLDPAEEADMRKVIRLATAAGMSRPAPDPGALAAAGPDYGTRWERSPLYRRLLEEATPEVRAAIAVADPPPPAPKPLTPAEVKDAFAEMMTAEGMDTGKPDPRGRMYSLIADKPMFGLSVMVIFTTLQKEGIGVARETIHRWLADDIKDGKIERIGASYRFPRPDGS